MCCRISHLKSRLAASLEPKGPSSYGPFPLRHEKSSEKLPRFAVDSSSLPILSSNDSSGAFFHQAAGMVPLRVTCCGLSVFRATSDNVELSLHTPLSQTPMASVTSHFPGFIPSSFSPLFLFGPLYHQNTVSPWIGTKTKYSLLSLE